jgi:hypothetical protein
MKRRHLLQTLAAAPAAAPLAPAQQAPPAEPQAKLTLTGPGAIGSQQPGYFTDAERAALRALCHLLVPPALGKPGALDCGVAEFLGFFISQSPAEDRQLWRTGLHLLDAESLRQHGAVFASLTAAQAATILEPLKAKWTYYGPREPLPKFLWTARNLALQATLNSREYAQADPGRRGSSGTNYYWRSLD